jgi:hypothetical protein
VQYRYRTGFSAKMRVSKRPKCIPDRSKKQVVIPSLIVQANGIQHMWHCKHNVVVLYRKGVMHQVVNPEGLFGRLAFWTMPVATTIVTVAHRTTVFACFFVSAKGGCTASGYFAQYR